LNEIHRPIDENDHMIAELALILILDESIKRALISIHKKS